MGLGISNISPPSSNACSICGHDLGKIVIRSPYSYGMYRMPHAEESVIAALFLRSLTMVQEDEYGLPPGLDALPWLALLVKHAQEDGPRLLQRLLELPGVRFRLRP